MSRYESAWSHLPIKSRFRNFSVIAATVGRTVLGAGEMRRAGVASVQEQLCRPLNVLLPRGQSSVGNHVYTVSTVMFPSQK